MVKQAPRSGESNPHGQKVPSTPRKKSLTPLFTLFNLFSLAWALLAVGRNFLQKQPKWATFTHTDQTKWVWNFRGPLGTLWPCGIVSRDIRPHFPPHVYSRKKFRQKLFYKKFFDFFLSIIHICILEVVLEHPSGEWQGQFFIFFFNFSKKNFFFPIDKRAKRGSEVRRIKSTWSESPKYTAEKVLDTSVHTF